jgi:anti-sigma factor RsiW
MLSLSGHIGTKASALVDGQLSRAEEERAWSHVLACPGCRRLVEHEGWTKRQLGSLAGPAEAAPPPQLLGSLYDVDAWAAVDAIEKRSLRRRTASLVVGGGAVGVCVLGLITVTGGATGRTDVPRLPTTDNRAQLAPTPSPSPSARPDRPVASTIAGRVGSSRPR